MKDHVVETIVAMDQHRFVVRRQVGGQPIEQAVHRLDLLGFGCFVLLAPTRDLAGHIAPRAAEIAETQPDIVDGMQAGQGLELGTIDREPPLLGNVR